MGLSVLPGRGDNRETGARPVQSRCRKEQLFSTRNAATGKPGRRRQGVNSEPEYLPTFMFRAALRATEMRKKAGRRPAAFCVLFTVCGGIRLFLFSGVNLDRFVYKSGEKLRCGYTTGSCAAAASLAAAEALLTGAPPERVELPTPKGITIDIPVAGCRISGNSALCSVIKDSGDDPDITNGIEVCARVELTEAGISIDGGEGIGRITKPGLDQPPGAAAINSVPRKMIAAAVSNIAETCDYHGGFRIVISVPNGAELASRTYNPRMGIEGGISIIGTTGIVEPMSNSALVDTIRLEERVRREEGCRSLLLTLGNYSQSFIQRNMPFALDRCVTCSNFIGEAIEAALEYGFERILIIGHIGKMAKLGAGIMNTHSAQADGRMEILVTCGLLAGADVDTLKKITECVTVDAAVSLLQDAGALEKSMEILGKRAEYYLAAKVKSSVPIGAVMFSDKFGILVRTPSADGLIERISEEYNG